MSELQVVTLSEMRSETSNNITLSYLLHYKFNAENGR